MFRNRMSIKASYTHIIMIKLHHLYKWSHVIDLFTRVLFKTEYTTFETDKKVCELKIVIFDK